VPHPMIAALTFTERVAISVAFVVIIACIVGVF
jgi:hypothetical protein